MIVHSKLVLEVWTKLIYFSVNIHHLKSQQNLRIRQIQKKIVLHKGYFIYNY